MEHLLNALYALTLLEQERQLNYEELHFYSYCIEVLNDNCIVIPFGIEL